mmetsp:Transcript_40478/g.108377  ORF Transcript_40478/g.108377 Transcript_40478/m.108377 type:complete len:216 (-) Transcript_40478:35-682(-)
MPGLIFKDLDGKPVNPASQWIAEQNAPLYDLLRPGMWMGDSVTHALHWKVSRRARFAHCRWILKGTEPASVARLLIDKAKTKGNFVVVPNPSNPLKVHIRFYTPLLQWLDIIDIDVTPTPRASGEVEATAHSFSAGLCPASCPCAPLISAANFFAPFKDHGKNLLHLRQLKNLLIENGIEVEEVVEWSGSKRVPDEHGAHTLSEEAYAILKMVRE